MKIRGAKSIEVTEQDVAEDSSFALKCFQHTVLHQVISKNKKTNGIITMLIQGNRLNSPFHLQVFSGELKREYYERKKEECHRLKHFRHESSVDLCGVCNLTLKREFDEKKNKDHPRFKAASFKKFRDRLDWSGVEFPSGQEDFKTFSKNNPGIILSIYREQSRGGDIYLEYRSPPPPENVEAKAVHLVYATRINLEECELEAHFLSVTNLSHLFGKILQYVDEKTGNPFTRETDRNVCKVCNEIFAFTPWGQGSMKTQVEKVQRNFLSETPNERVTKLYSVSGEIL